MDVIPCSGSVRTNTCPKGILEISWGKPFWGILMVFISVVLALKDTKSASGEQIKQKERPLVPPDADMKVWKVEYNS